MKTTKQNINTSMIKEPLPYTWKHYQYLRVLRKESVERFNESFQNRVKTKDTDFLQKQVHDIVEKIYEYDNVINYNKFASNRCKFYNSDETEEACEGFFKNTIHHYSIHGNCCQSCSNVFNTTINLRKPKEEVKTEIKYFVEDFVIPNNDLD